MVLPHHDRSARGIFYNADERLPGSGAHRHGGGPQEFTNAIDPLCKESVDLIGHDDGTAQAVPHRHGFVDPSR
jgi:hypothetical protein